MPARAEVEIWKAIAAGDEAQVRDYLSQVPRTWLAQQLGAARKTSDSHHARRGSPRWWCAATAYVAVLLLHPLYRYQLQCPWVSALFV